MLCMLKKSKSQQNPWYHKGLHFDCHRCGYCCTFPGGYVWLSLEEIQILADHLALSLEKFGQKYLRLFRGRYSLVEKSNEHCIFYEDGGCSVYHLRPAQCQTFPFWPENLDSPESWKALGKTCQGVDQDKLRSCEEISETLNRQIESEQNL